ncbi:DUF5665 domain-containing protein [Paenibacillus chartarius]|uniref:DUF5665 domain-containing protein n=1 Tax=Paenibacillus chartarius TaxID=747481 RepID=A0ABV6DNF3_9BACL
MADSIETGAVSEQRKLIVSLRERIDEIAWTMEKSQIADYVQLMHKPWRLAMLNLVSGISRGVGIAIGFTIFTSTIVYVLQALGALNLPIIGDYIANLIEHVQQHLEREGYTY